MSLHIACGQLLSGPVPIAAMITVGGNQTVDADSDQFALKTLHVVLGFTKQGGRDAPVDEPFQVGGEAAVDAEGTLWTMAEITVRVLNESEWSLYRDVRLGALAESPGSFTATLVEEADRDEQFWRDRMTRSHRLLAERGRIRQGIVSLGPYKEEPSAAEVFGLYVVPEARGTGVSWRLVEAAAALATQEAYLQLYYWVGTENGRAVGFANNFGFRVTDYRRPSRSSDLDPGEEIAMVLSLEPDATSAPNPTSGKPASREGPLS